LTLLFIYFDFILTYKVPVFATAR